MPFELNASMYHYSQVNKLIREAIAKGEKELILTG